MNKKTKQEIIRYFVYAIVLVLLFSLQTTPRLFEISGVKPVLIIPYVLCIAMFENEVASAIFAAFGGMLWDLSSSCVFGFNAIIFLVFGVIISLLVMYLLRAKLLNFLAFLSIAMLIQGFLYYAFYYVLWNTASPEIILTKYILPTIVYTVVMGIPIYYLVKLLSRKLSEQVRM